MHDKLDKIRSAVNDYRSAFNNKFASGYVTSREQNAVEGIRAAVETIKEALDTIEGYDKFLDVQYPEGKKPPSTPEGGKAPERKENDDTAKRQWFSGENE